MTYSPSHALDGPPMRRVQMVRIPMFFVKRAECSSVIHHMIVNIHINERVMRYRTEFGCLNRPIAMASFASNPPLARRRGARVHEMVVMP